MKVKYNYLSEIASNISKLYSEGLNFNNIFELLDDLSLDVNYKNAIKDIKLKILNGNSLEESLKYHNKLFPYFFTSMIGIGEKTGKIVEVLDGLNLFYSKIWFIQKFILNAIKYPIILLTTLAAVIVFLCTVALPNFVDIYISLEKDIPIALSMVMNINEFVSKHRFQTFIYIICWFFGIPIIVYKFYLKENLNKIFYKVPIYNKISEYINIVLLTIVIKSGINLVNGLELCGKVNIFNKNNEIIKEISESISKGNTLSESMINIKCFSKYTIAHVKLGEESGGLEDRLMQLENYLFNKIQTSINKTIELIQPTLIIIIAVLMLMFIFVFILPIFRTLL